MFFAANTRVIHPLLLSSSTTMMEYRYSKLMPSRKPKKSTTNGWSDFTCTLYVLARLVFFGCLCWVLFLTSTLFQRVDDLDSHQISTTDVGTCPLTILNQQTCRIDNFITFASASMLMVEELESVQEPKPQFADNRLGQSSHGIQAVIPLKKEDEALILTTILSIFTHYVAASIAFDVCYNRSAHAKYLYWGCYATWAEMLVISLMMGIGYFRYSKWEFLELLCVFILYLGLMSFYYFKAAVDTEEGDLDVEGMAGNNPDPHGEPNQSKNPDPTGMPHLENVRIHYYLERADVHFRTLRVDSGPSARRYTPSSQKSVEEVVRLDSNVRGRGRVMPPNSA